MGVLEAKERGQGSLCLAVKGAISARVRGLGYRESSSADHGVSFGEDLGSETKFMGHCFRGLEWGSQ